jgi:GNAT superfamily N-acetyltransferase
MSADLRVCEEDASRLSEYARVSIAFDVDRVCEPVSRSASGGPPFALNERLLATPWRKDYDATSGNHPSDWGKRFDLTHWCVLAAYRGHERVGGAVLVARSPELDMLEGRDDLAMLWDLRIAPHSRRSGIGRALFEAAKAWTRAQGCTRLKVETQNINAPACRFYADQGCRLEVARRDAYSDHPEEIQLLWYLDLHSSEGEE